jgi:hypothetical protein
MEQAVLGYFDKPLARQYQEALEDDGVDLLIEASDSEKFARQVKLCVSKDNYSRAVEMIKNLQAQASIDARAKAMAEERKTIIWFFIFVLIFIGYVVLSRA